MPKRPCDMVRLYEELDLLINRLPIDDNRVKWMRDMEKVLAENRYAGEQVKQELIPRRYKQKFGVNNLYRYHHPRGFRSTYTILTPTKGIFYAIILDLLSHDEYEDLFGY